MMPLLDLPRLLPSKLRPPLGIILGAPRETADLVAALGLDKVTCYQMDLYQAERLRDELKQWRVKAEIFAAADLWDFAGELQTLIFPAPEGGERILNLDMIEQAYHVLKPAGTLIVVSPVENDVYFPTALRKIYGRIHVPKANGGSVFWCQHTDERPRRRHEVTFQVQNRERGSLHFLSRPGVFSYGRFDDGARFLVQTMEIRPGERVLDLGCGCGTKGVFAGLRCEPGGSVTFVDSNLRAVALAEINARQNGLTSFCTRANSGVEGIDLGAFDVVLANPPYYAQLKIAQRFIEHAHALLRPAGRLYLVTKLAEEVGALLAERFSELEAAERRGYIVFHATK